MWLTWCLLAHHLLGGTATAPDVDWQVVDKLIETDGWAAIAALTDPPYASSPDTAAISTSSEVATTIGPAGEPLTIGVDPAGGSPIICVEPPPNDPRLLTCPEDSQRSGVYCLSHHNLGRGFYAHCRRILYRDPTGQPFRFDRKPSRVTGKCPRGFTCLKVAMTHTALRNRASWWPFSNKPEPQVKCVELPPMDRMRSYKSMRRGVDREGRRAQVAANAGSSSSTEFPRPTEPDAADSSHSLTIEVPQVPYDPNNELVWHDDAFFDFGSP